MNDFQKLANLFKLIRAGAAARNSGRILRAKQIRTPGDLQLPTDSAQYIPKIPKVTKSTPNQQVNELGNVFGAEKLPAPKIRNVGTPTPKGMEPLTQRLSAQPQGRLRRLLNLGRTKPLGRKYSEDAVNQQLNTLTDKVWSPKGGGVRQLRRLGDQTSKVLRQINSKKLPFGLGGVRKRLLRKVRKAGAAEEEMFRGINKPLKKNPQAQHLMNRMIERHELAERAASRRFPNTPRFESHINPAPALNDMNVAASLTGPGSDAARQAVRAMRKPELQRLGATVYPRANLNRFDPRNLLPSTKRQQAAYNEMQNLGLPGNRLNRRRIKNIMDLYEDAGRRNTYAFRRASNPMRRDQTNLGMFAEDLRGKLFKFDRAFPKLIGAKGWGRQARDASLIGGGGGGAGFLTQQKSSRG